MKEEIKLLENKFKEIKEMGWVASTRKGATGVGKTFEDLIGKQEDSLNFPDFHGIEIKTKRNSTGQPFGLFSAEPDGEELFEAERIRIKYGYPNKRYPKFLVFCCSVKANKETKLNTYYFSLKVNREEKKIYLIIFNSNHELIEQKTSWSFQMLQEMLERKLTYLAIIKAYNKFENGIEYFKYNKLQIFERVNFEKFISLIEQGKIIITFNIGIFTGEYRFGQPHNHGTCFSIYEKDIKFLYEKNK